MTSNRDLLVVATKGWPETLCDENREYCRNVLVAIRNAMMLGKFLKAIATKTSSFLCFLWKDRACSIMNITLQIKRNLKMLQGLQVQEAISKVLILLREICARMILCQNELSLWKHLLGAKR